MNNDTEPTWPPGLFTEYNELEKLKQENKLLQDRIDEYQKAVERLNSSINYHIKMREPGAKEAELQETIAKLHDKIDSIRNAYNNYFIIIHEAQERLFNQHL